MACSVPALFRLSCLHHFTPLLRFRNLSLWLIWHTLYSKHAPARVTLQNLSYLFFLSSVRLTSSLATMDRQLGMRGRLVEAYRTVIEDPEYDEHRYLMLDVAPGSNPKFRLRSQIHDDVQVVYL